MSRRKCCREGLAVVTDRAWFVNRQCNGESTSCGCSTESCSIQCEQEDGHEGPHGTLCYEDSPENADGDHDQAHNWLTWTDEDPNPRKP